jgi:hypothetical protein
MKHSLHRKYMILKGIPAVFSFLLILIFPLTGYSETEKSLLIHVTSVPDSDENQFYAIPQLALKALQKGHRVTILFDGRGVKLIKIGHWYGGDTTILDKVEVTEEERQLLSAELGLPPSSVPGNYGDFIRFMKGRGVHLFANGKMMKFYGIGDEEYDFVVIPVGPDRVLQIIEETDIYVSY